MSLAKQLKKTFANFIPSPLDADFKRERGYVIREVAPYPKEVFWDERVPIYKTSAGVEYVRTPEERFENLPGYDFSSHYLDIDGMRMHYVDEGPKSGPIVLLLHGQPTWSYLYRKMIKVLVPKGYRCIAPDLMGMGKSDKPIREQYHTYDKHCENILAFIQKLELSAVTLFIQDWGSLIGNRIAGENPALFAGIVMANGDLPLGTAETNKLFIPNPVVINPKVKHLKPAMAKYALKGGLFGFQAWVLFCLTNRHNFIGEVMQMTTHVTLTPGEIAAYEAPFPSFIYMAGPRTLPSMSAGLRGQQLKAWEGLQKFEKPYLSLIGLKDRLLGRPSIQKKWIENVPGAKGQAHDQFENGNHFIQEDLGEEMADRIDKFMRQ